MRTAPATAPGGYDDVASATVTRIVGGEWSGRRLAAPTGAATRPTAEKVRAAVANALQAAGALDGASVLDLYAGTGAFGLELVSRGAASAVLVERARAAQQAIRDNIAAIGAAQVTLLPVDVSRIVSRALTGPFQVVVADPPYDEPDAAVSSALAALVAAGLLSPGADIVLERSSRSGPFPWPDGFTGLRDKRYGDTVICYGQAP